MHTTDRVHCPTCSRLSRQRLLATARLSFVTRPRDAHGMPQSKRHEHIQADSLRPTLLAPTWVGRVHPKDIWFSSSRPSRLMHDLTVAGHNVRFWHKADMLLTTRNVRFRRKSGHRD
jgi:hypothetical protein